MQSQRCCQIACAGSELSPGVEWLLKAPLRRFFRETTVSKLRIARGQEQQLSKECDMNHLLHEIVSPVGRPAIRKSGLAQRRGGTVAGLRVGLLDNNKPNADKFLSFT